MNQAILHPDPMCSADWKADGMVFFYHKGLADNTIKLMYLYRNHLIFSKIQILCSQHASCSMSPFEWLLIPLSVRHCAAIATVYGFPVNLLTD